jgi:hypothetical protein
MNGFLSKRTWATFLAAAGLLCLIRPAAGAVPIPPGDHYWVYDLSQTIPAPAPIAVSLVDQFEGWNHHVYMLRHFANPAEKTFAGVVSPIFDPRLHYTWWEIDPHPFHRPGIQIMNQFGPQTLDVFDPHYLLNPATKNEPAAFPIDANHYKCYDCEGAPVNADVILTDQFGQRTAQVMFPRLLCNPVIKQTAEGRLFPIVDPKQHLVCYEIPPMPWQYSAIVWDQFVQGHPLEIGPDRWLCVPSEKFDPTPVTPQTWGRIKTLYR